jgi:hypothetical protein
MNELPDDGTSDAARFVADFAAGWSSPNYEEFIAYFCDRFDANVLLSQPMAADGIGHSHLREQFRRLFILFPDLNGTVERWAARDNQVFVQLRLTGTLGRKPVAWTACDVLVLRGRVATERRSFFDPGPVRRAILRRPAAWPRLVRSLLPHSRPRRPRRQRSQGDR